MLTVELEVGGSLMKVEENCRKFGRVCKSTGGVTVDGSLFPLFSFSFVWMSQRK